MESLGKDALNVWIHSLASRQLAAAHAIAAPMEVLVISVIRRLANALVR